MRGYALAGTTVTLAAAIALSGALAVEAQSASSATARLEPGLVGVGQTLTLTLEAQSTGLKDLQLDPKFSLENLEIVSGPMQSQSWQFVNGRASRSESLIWRLRALEVGPARVTEIVLKVNGEPFELSEQGVEVQEDPVPTEDAFGRPQSGDPFEGFPFTRRRRTPAQTSEPKLFLRAEVTPAEPYAGQQVLYTLYLFTQADVGSINPESVPEFEGFWVEDVPQPERLRPEMVEVQGQRYGRVVLLRKAAFPMRPGQVELEPVRARLVVSMPEYTWLGSVIDRKREIVRTSNPVTLNVRPLPEAPAGFHGTVGKLQLSAELAPAELDVGQASTLTVKLEGQGNIQGVQGPKLPTLDGVRVFPPEQSSNTRISGTRVRGNKTWEYVLVPDQAGEWEIPPLSIPYFDPFDEEFKTAKARPAILAARAPLSAQPSVSLQEGTADSEVAGAPEPLEEPVSPVRPIWRSRWAAIPAALALALLLLPVVLRYRRKNRSTQKLCSRLRDANNVRHGRRAAEALENAWREFLEERFDLADAVPVTSWSHELKGRRMRSTQRDELGRLVQDMEYLRYAPELSASESLVAELVARSLKLARALG